MRITANYLALCLTSTLSLACMTGATNAAEVITASEYRASSASVNIFRPPVSAFAPDEAAPEQSAPETKIIVKVPVYVTTRRARNNLWWPYRASDRAFGPNYPGFRNVYFGPLYPF